MAKRFGYLAFAGAGIGFFIGLMYVRPGHGALPGLAIGALLGRSSSRSPLLLTGSRATSRMAVRTRASNA